MARLERFGTHSDRQLCLLELATLDDVTDDLTFPPNDFICLLALDPVDSSDEEIRRALTVILKHGTVYFCAWGPDCERVHDIADRLIIETGMEDPEDLDVIMTTWHEEESLEEAVWFFLFTAWPAGNYEERCRAELAVVVGNAAWAETVRAALRDPDAFSERVLGQKKGQG